MEICLQLLDPGGINEIQYAAFFMMIALTQAYKPGVFTYVVANEQIYDRHPRCRRRIIKNDNYSMKKENLEFFHLMDSNH